MLFFANLGFASGFKKTQIIYFTTPLSRKYFYEKL